MVPVRRCDHCHEPLALTSRADARYCSTRCRVAAHRAEHAGEDPLPAELRTRDRWVRHRAKRPIQVNGKPASTTDPATWTTWAAASASRRGDGLGFVLAEGLVCLDLDHCISGNHVAPWAESLLSVMPATYAERSPSGEGLHVWGRADLENGRVVAVVGGRIEVHTAGRYMTMTGRRFRRAPAVLADLAPFLASLDL